MNQPKHPIEVAYDNLRQDLINYITNFVESKGGVFYFIGEYDTSTPEGLNNFIGLKELNRDLMPITCGLSDLFFEQYLNINFASVAKIEIVNSSVNDNGKQLKFAITPITIDDIYDVYETNRDEDDEHADSIDVTDLSHIFYHIEYNFVRNNLVPKTLD